MNVKHYVSPLSYKITLLKRTEVFFLRVVCLRLVVSERTNPQSRHQFLPVSKQFSVYGMLNIHHSFIFGRRILCYTSSAMALGLFIAWTWPVLAWFWQHEPIKAWCVCNGRKLCLLSTVAKLVIGMFFEFVTTKRNGCMMVGGMLHMRFICLHLARV